MAMSDRAFIDTNILVYLYSSQEPEKRDVCVAELDQYVRVVSTQVINELSSVLFKRFALCTDRVREHIENVKQLAEIATIGLALIDEAISLKETYGYNYYDCLMLASALGEDCTIILTEDLCDGQVINNKLRIVNPF
jgi:predicted nucleic acid-binding protein